MNERKAVNRIVQGDGDPKFSYVAVGDPEFACVDGGNLTAMKKS